MATILPSQLPAASSVNNTAAIIVDTGSVVQKATPAQLLDAAAPVASEAEALAGEDNTKRMTALRTRQALGELVSDKAMAGAVGIAGDAENLGAFGIPLIADNVPVKAAIASIGTGLASNAGSSFVGFLQAGTGATASTLQAQTRLRINVKQFGAIGNPAIADDTAEIQAALDYAETLVAVDSTWNANASVEVVLTGGAYRISATLKVPNYVSFIGEGREVSVLTTDDDIVMIESKADINGSAANVSIVGMKLVKERTASTTYHVVLNNPVLCTFRDVYTFTKIADASANPTYFGGLKLARAGTFVGPNFINRIHDCFIQNGGVLIDDVTDGEITDCYIYGHNVNHSLKFLGNSGNYNISGNNLTSPQANAAIWLASNEGANFRITCNFFDGLVPELLKGHGILSDRVNAVLIANNHFTHQLSGIRAVQPFFWTVTGNHFRNCNNKDSGATAGTWPDIEIIGLATYNTFAANTHQQTDSRSPNQGYAILETADGSGSPANNAYSANAMFGVSGGYLQNSNGFGPMSVSPNSRINGITGYNSEQLSPTVQMGDDGISVSISGDVSGSGTLDMTVNTESYFGNDSSFVGTLYVASTRLFAATVSRRAVYAVFCRGTTSTFTQIGADHDGSGGGATFTLSTPSNGVIRFNDGTTEPVAVRMTFIGTKALA